MNEQPLHPRDRRPQKIAVLPGRRHRQGRDRRGGEGDRGRRRALEPAARDASTFPGARITTWRPASAIPPDAFEWLPRDYAAIYIGAYGDPRIPDMRHAADILLGIRFKLDLFINLRPVKLYDARLCPLKGQARAGRRLRGLSREHRGRLRRHRRQLQGRHPGRDCGAERRSTPARGWSGSSAPPSTTPSSTAARTSAWPTRSTPSALPATSGSGSSTRCASEYPQITQPPPLRRRADHADGAAAARASTSSSPTTCSATSSPISARRSRAASASPPRPTSIPAAPRCSSRSMARRRSTRAPAAPTRSAPSSRRR